LDPADELNNKLLEYLNGMDQKGEQTADRFDHWSKMASDRLRQLPMQSAMAAIMKFDQIMYEIEFPSYSSVSSYTPSTGRYDLGNFEN